MTARALCRHLIKTPLGFAGIIFDPNGSALRRVLLPGKAGPAGATFREALHVSSSQHLPVNVRRFCRDLAAYFNGEPVDFTGYSLDLSHLTELEREVLDAVSKVSYGERQSYGHIARSIGRPRAHRFVGTTLGKNPFPVAIPCHRIVRSDGSLGKFGGGTDLKRRMLEMELAAARRKR